MHEFYVLGSGATAMHIVQRVELADVAHLQLEERFEGMTAGLVANMGIREVDLHTGEAVFSWWASDHINLNTSTYPPRNLDGPYPNGWDWLHLNAIDKNSEGDYLITARYTDAVYKVSKKDGHVIWTLGGPSTSFQLQASTNHQETAGQCQMTTWGFDFTRPHDARFVSSDDTSETITLLDNGGCEESKSSDTSSALILHLDKSSSPWIATVKRRWLRPDNGRSDKRGNFQLLPNGNAFVGWSENSYISEHSPDGEVLMEAQFTSDRFVTYRAYKFNFTSAPAELPVLKGFAYGLSPDQSVSVYYVSWNGATEVAHWEFYTKEHEFLGRVERSGFETMFQQTSRYADEIYAQALSADNRVLSRSKMEEIRNPSGWAADHALIKSILQAANEDGGKDEL
ncbi:putative arylsulfotransferase [Septoria linicola]|nr:putative arylsulfotransferase [Septoria linicola]